MTREEAIRIIETVFQDEYVYKYYDSITHQALEVAIEALSAEADISEYADRLWKIAYERGKAESEAKTKCVAQIKVDTEEVARRIKEEYDITDGWIPCSERLPEEDGWYLVTVQGYETVTDVSLYSADGCAWGDVSTKQKVIAWMPLPKPYREDGELNV